jgi:hypothetical protein
MKKISNYEYTLRTMHKYSVGSRPSLIVEEDAYVENSPEMRRGQMVVGVSAADESS